MAKNNDQSVDIFIEDELDNKKRLVKSTLRVPYQADNKDKALRVFDGNNIEAIYVSTRLNSLQAAEGGYEVDVTVAGKENLIGKSFELKDVTTKKIVLKGKVATKKSEAQIIDLAKAANQGK